MSLCGSLHDAIQEGDIDTVIRLAKNGANINMPYNQETAFTRALAVGRSNIAYQILKLPNFNPNAGNQFDRTPLFFAAQEGHYELAKMLLDMGAEVDLGDIRGVTPLGATAWYNKHQVAELLIERGANVNQQDDSGESPLFRACYRVSRHVAEVLLASGADVNIQTFEKNSCPKFTPLMAALPSKYELEVQGRQMTEMISLTKMMLSSCCDLNAVQKHGRSALHIAVDKNELFGACLLAENGCDLEVKDKDGLTPLQLAVQPIRPHYEMALILLLYGADVNTKFKDTESGKDILPLTMVLKTRLDNELELLHRQRLLHALISATDLSRRAVFEVIETMLEKIPVIEEDVKILEEHNINQACSLQGHCRLIIRKSLGQQILNKLETLPIGWQLKRYISLDFDYRRNLPINTCTMHVSVMDGNTSELRKLLAEGTDVNSPLGGRIPLTLAAERGNTAAVQVLLEHRADPEMLDREGQSALHAAAHHGSNDVIRLLQGTQCDINAINNYGNTPIQEAAHMGHFDTVMLLLDHGANPSIVGSAGIPVLHLAAGSGHMKAVEHLVLSSHSMVLLDKFANSPLHIAASRGIVYLKNNIRLPALYNAEVFEMLDAVRIPLNYSGPKYVRSEGVDHLGVLKLLLQHHIDTGILNVDEQSAVDLATEYLPEAVELF